MLPPDRSGFQAEMAQPTHVNGFAPSNQSPGPFREGGHLVVASGAVLPGICPLTGEAAPHGWRRSMQLCWEPPGAGALPLFFGLSGYVELMGLEKNGRMSYTLSSKGVWRVIRRFLLSVSAFVAAPPCFIAGCTGETVQWGWILASVVLVGLFTWSNSTGLRVTGYSGGWFWIKGCSPDFLKMLPSSRRWS
jgi:hypothetical protein